LWIFETASAQAETNQLATVIQITFILQSTDIISFLRLRLENSRGYKEVRGKGVRGSFSKVLLEKKIFLFLKK
jgi:hypothetical protein